MKTRTEIRSALLEQIKRYLKSDVFGDIAFGPLRQSLSDEEDVVYCQERDLLLSQIEDGVMLRS